MNAREARTHQERYAHERRVALVRNPGTPTQRAIRTCDGTHDALRDALAARARETFPGQPLAWLHHADGHLEPIE